jgi:hypothetical protein
MAQKQAEPHGAGLWSEALCLSLQPILKGYSEFGTSIAEMCPIKEEKTAHEPMCAIKLHVWLCKVCQGAGEISVSSIS